MAPFKHLNTKKNDTVILGRAPEDWQVLKTQEGRPYYYNKVTKITQWEKPDELKTKNELESLQSTIQNLEKEISKKSSSKSRSRERSQSYDEEVEQERKSKTKEELEEKFFEMLKDQKVTTDMDWNKAYKYISQDRRYKLIESVQEKKKLFNDYIMNKKNKEKEIKKSRQTRQREDFFELLSKTNSINTYSTYKKILPIIQHDPRFLAVERESDRLEYFDDYIIDLYKKEKRTAEEMRNTQKDSFRKLLENRARIGKITTKTFWRDIADDFRGMPAYENLEKVDRLDVWLTFMRDFEIREEELKMREKHKKKKLEQKNRSIFWNYLKSLKLNRNSSYVELLPHIDSLPIYYSVIEQSGPLPKEIFQDYVHELELEYRDDTKFLKNLLKEIHLNLDSQHFNSFDEFFNFLKLKIKDKESFNKINEENLRSFFETEFINPDKKKKKYFDNFKDLLKSLPQMNAHSEFYDIRPLIVDSYAFESVPTEEERRMIFDEVVAKMKKKEKKRRREDEDLEELQRRKKQILNELNQ
jgi:pre-mRNA-processing factor 40